MALVALVYSVVPADFRIDCSYFSGLHGVRSPQQDMVSSGDVMGLQSCFIRIYFLVSPSSTSVTGYRKKMELGCP